jgi:hypothetical protein
MQAKILDHFNLYASVIGGHPKDSLEFIISESPPSSHRRRQPLTTSTLAYTHTDRKRVEFFRKNIENDSMLATITFHELGHTLVDPGKKKVTLSNGETIYCEGIQCNENRNHKRLFEESAVSFIAEHLLRILHNKEAGFTGMVTSKKLRYYRAMSFWFDLESYTLNKTPDTIAESIYLPAFLEALQGNQDELFTLLNIKNTGDLQQYQDILTILHSPVNPTHVAMALGHEKRLNVVYAARKKQQRRDALANDIKMY